MGQVLMQRNLHGENYQRSELAQLVGAELFAILGANHLGLEVRKLFAEDIRLFHVAVAAVIFH